MTVSAESIAGEVENALSASYCSEWRSVAHGKFSSPLLLVAVPELGCDEHRD